MSPAAAPPPSPRAPILARTIAGFGSQAWSALLAVLCFPVYIRLLGMDGFGLIGFHVTLQIVLRSLDLGMTPTVIREIARSTGSPEGGRELATRAGTFETLFAATGAAIAVTLVALSGTIAHHWLRSDAFSAETLATCVALMGLQCGVTWISGFQQSALLGLERQVVVHVLKAAEATFNWLGSLVVLLVVTPDIRLMFLWQLGVSVLGLGIYAWTLRRTLPEPMRFGGFEREHLLRARHFTAGMAGIAALGLILTNMDKVVLSRLLALDRFGDYTLAAFAAGTVYSALFQPVTHAIFPRFSVLIAAGDEASLRDVYHLAIQLLAVLAIPILMTLIAFGEDFLAIWMGNEEVARAAAGPLAWLAAGMTCSTLMTPTYQLRIAHGWTSFDLRFNLLLLAIFLPTLFWASQRHGMIGAAVNYAAFNALYGITLPLTHMRYLPRQTAKVLLADIGPSVLVSVPWLFLAKLPGISSLPTPGRVAIGAGMLVIMLASAVCVSSRIRTEILRGDLSRSKIPPN